MKDAADLVRAIAQLAWPLIVLTAILVFRRQFSELLPRLRHLELLGQKADIEQQLNQLQISAVSGETEVEALPMPAATPQPTPNTFDIARQVLELAATSPRAALLLLSSEIERELHHLFASTGIQPIPPPPIRSYFPGSYLPLPMKTSSAQSILASSF